MKISKNKNSAGHKGVQSIIDSFGNKNFIRFRVGINQNSKCKTQNTKLQPKTQNIEKFMLEKITKQEQKILEKIIDKTCAAIEMAIKQGTEKAMAEYNKS